MSKKVLEEEEYIESLSHIIARDYYPLLENENGATVNLSLDQFQTKYTSQDNHSFNQIIQKNNSERSLKIQPFYEQKLIKSSSKGSIETWDYKIKNNLIFGPEGIDEIKPLNSKKSISHSNTRLDMPPPSSIPFRKDSMADTAFDLVPNTPSIEPGAVFDPSELMTWGTIEATPIRVDETPGFQIPPTPVRDLIGIQLADKSKKKKNTHERSSAYRLLARSNPYLKPHMKK